ncbi:uncharacterized protein LOC106652243 [Trichogramma pretiosum]|uniref:uncharacterized protein LOC106652243 n=1 Tax=Trichogramma pretiosum TaxID=7493 RepID=UPI000C719502|nr:uncharacterized protein LOC106652243 [Trichogramma pretiosum]
MASKSNPAIGRPSVRPEDAQEAVKDCTLKKKIPPQEPPCAKEEEWKCSDDPPWRTYMRMFVDDLAKKREDEQETSGMFNKTERKPRAPLVKEEYLGKIVPSPRPIHAFSAEVQKACTLPDPIWKVLRDNPSSANENVKSRMDWPRSWPCIDEDDVRKMKIRLRKMKMKKMLKSPCEVNAIDSPGTSDDERMEEMAHQKELGHARIPVTKPKPDIKVTIDRACGNQPGLVFGDYIYWSLTSKNNARLEYANVCLRGLTGMHLGELSRSRRTTWKFCLYQAMVALLAKTQLRYKFAWGANIDYIYQHAWLLFTHIGHLNIKERQIFDDVLVFNYNYSIELELIQELCDVPMSSSIGFKYLEKEVEVKRQKLRPELTLTEATFGTQRHRECARITVNKYTKSIEKWFDGLEMRYNNCIIRTSRFSMAFWQEGSFWYLYNPYRCSDYGFWDDSGYACIMKFCSRDALKRHLMLLTVRAYTYEAVVTQQEKDLRKRGIKRKHKFTVQIYQVIFHSCRIHNVKLFTRGPRKAKLKLTPKDKESCTYDPEARLTDKTCDDPESPTDIDRLSEKLEKSIWLDQKHFVWKRSFFSGLEPTPKWQYYDVIQPGRFYVLWGKYHITDERFAEENRNRQASACYAVCAAMVLINTPEYWTPQVLDAIVVCGDDFYTNRALSLQTTKSHVDEDDWNLKARDSFSIGEIECHVQALPVICGQLYLRGHRCLWRSIEKLFQEHEFAVLACENSRLGVFKHFGVYYLCDVKSYGPPIFVPGDGSVYLLRTTCIEELIGSIILIIGSPECSQFTLRPLEIVRMKDTSRGAPCDRKRPRKCGDDDEDEGAAKKKCPLKSQRCPYAEDKLMQKKIKKVPRKTCG